MIFHGFLGNLGVNLIDLPKLCAGLTAWKGSNSVGWALLHALHTFGTLPALLGPMRAEFSRRKHQALWWSPDRNGVAVALWAPSVTHNASRSGVQVPGPVCRLAVRPTCFQALLEFGYPENKYVHTFFKFSLNFIP